jgi:predicted nucleic acid-binding protein
MVGAISVLFNRILVPRAVRAEIAAGGERNRAVTAALADFAIFEPCDDYEAALVRLLLDTRAALAEGEDQGEAEAIVQAARRSADMILVDDALGRRWAEAHSIECHGTLWLFDELRFRGYLGEVRPHFEQLIRTQRRQPLELMNSLLRRYGEQEITAQDFRRLASASCESAC